MAKADEAFLVFRCSYYCLCEMSREAVHVRSSQELIKSMSCGDFFKSGARGIPPLANRSPPLELGGFSLLLRNSLPPRAARPKAQNTKNHS